MSVESTTDGGTADGRSRRERFREWRSNRPFAGGVLLMLAGLVIAWVPLQFAFELLLVGGSYTFIGLFWAIAVFLTGAFVLYRPEFSTIFGVLGVVLSILSLLGALGGMLLGMILGIVGGNLCVSWSPPKGAADRREHTQGGDDRPVRTDGGEFRGARRTSSGSRPDGGSSDPRSDDDPHGADDDRPEIMTDGGRPLENEDETVPGDDGGVAAAVVAAASGSVAAVRNALADVVSDDEAELAESVAAGLRDRLDDAREFASQPRQESLRELRHSAAGLAGAVRPGEASRRLAAALALVVVAGGTLSVVGTLPAAALFGDDEGTTYTVDAEEIRLAEGGQICAASVDSDTYRVTITDATLVDATVYKQEGGDAVKTHFPRLSVDDTIVMYTESDDENLELLATTMGCTDEDQTSRTVFRNQYQIGEQLHGSEGVTMLNIEATDASVPEPGGFQFVAPDGNGSSATNVSGGVEHVADDVDDVLNDSLVDRLENGTGGGFGVNETAEGVDETVGNATDGPAGADAVANATDATEEAVSTVGETVANTTRDTLENTTREVAGDDPPENVSGTADGTTDAVDTATGEVENTTDDVTDATDEVANSTGDETTSTAVDDTTDAVDGTTETVTNTTDTVTDDVDDTTDQVVRPVEETATPESTETSEPTPSPTEVPITPTDVLTPTATPEDETPAWLDQVDEDERTSVLETIEATDGGFESVENVTEETDGYSEATIDGDENLTRLDNGTVLLLNGTDADSIDWGTVEDTLDTDLTSTETAGTDATTSATDSGTETDDGNGSDDGGTVFG